MRRLVAALLILPLTACGDADKAVPYQNVSRNDLPPISAPASISVGERDAIMWQIAKCWSVPPGPKSQTMPIVTLMAEYEKDGKLIRVNSLGRDVNRYSKDPYFKAVTDSAVRAVKACAPIHGLPEDTYDSWKSMMLVFNPKYVLK